MNHYQKQTFNVAARDNSPSRYNDEELEEFRQIVLCRLAEARTDFEQLRASLAGEGDNGTNDTSPVFGMGEESSEFSSREDIARLAHRRQNYISQLMNALVRIENKTYGICRVSGKLIPRERLRTVPHTTMCIDAKVNGIRA